MFKEIDDTIIIGNADAVYQYQTLVALGVTGVVRLYQPPPAWPQAPITILSYPIPDGHPIPATVFDDCLEFINDQQQQGGRVAVVCRAGISRSATIVLAYLVSKGCPLQQAFEHLVRVYPQADPNPALWRSLLFYFDLPFDMMDIVAWGIAAR